MKSTSSIVCRMATKNLQRRPVRTLCMMFFVFMLSTSLFCSSVLVDSMQGTLQKTTDRLGADIIVVPEEYEREMADSLFLGELCSFTFDREFFISLVFYVLLTVLGIRSILKGRKLKKDE